MSHLYFIFQLFAHLRLLESGPVDELSEQTGRLSLLQACPFKVILWLCPLTRLLTALFSLTQPIVRQALDCLLFWKLQEVPGSCGRGGVGVGVLVQCCSRPQGEETARGMTKEICFSSVPTTSKRHPRSCFGPSSNSKQKDIRAF